ncbi:MAG: hypothetical protein H6625_11065 [Bdellovibrionaceae bacterium]|nr:hypothetical protein [Pseudobdellovibrionaceae bacterium]
MKFLIIPTILLFSAFTLISCTMYESDARKYLREQGFEFSAKAKASQLQLSQKHCYKKLSYSPSQWENSETDIKYTIHYIDTTFSCTFEKTKPSFWSEEEYSLISKIVEYYISNL